MNEEHRRPITLNVHRQSGTAHRNVLRFARPKRRPTAEEPSNLLRHRPRFVLLVYGDQNEVSFGHQHTIGNTTSCLMQREARLPVVREDGLKRQYVSGPDARHEVSRHFADGRANTVAREDLHSRSLGYRFPSSTLEEAHAR
jgi:hypothetical protein